MVESDRQHNKANSLCMLDNWGYTHTHTHTEYVIIIAFPWREWLGGRTSTYILSLVILQTAARLRAALLSDGDSIARCDGTFFTSPNVLHRVWALFSLSPMDTLGSLHEKHISLGANLNAHLHQVPQVKNIWICASTTSYYFKTLCFIKQKNNFSIYSL